MTDSNPQAEYTALLARALDVQAEMARRLLELRDGQDRMARQGEDVPAEDRARAVEQLGELLRAARAAYAELVADADTSEPAQTTIATLGELAAGYWQRIGEQRDAAPTGLARLNAKLGGGLQPRRLMVLLGAPGSGKTTLANQIAEHVADGGRPVLYLTMEDPAPALLAKTVARLGQLDYGAVLQGRAALRDQIDATLAAVTQRASATHLLYLEDSGRLALDAVKATARAHFARYPSGDADTGAGAGLLVVDYLQRWARALRGVPGESRELREVVSWLCEALRELARELDCTVLALASQNRASGYGRTIGTDALASAKESGDIEYAADVLMALSKDQERNPPIRQEAMVLHLPKNRQGETGKIDLNWYAARQSFTEATE